MLIDSSTFFLFHIALPNSWIDPFDLSERRRETEKCYFRFENVYVSEWKRLFYLKRLICFIAILFVDDKMCSFFTFRFLFRSVYMKCGIDHFDFESILGEIFILLVFVRFFHKFLFEIEQSFQRSTILYENIKGSNGL